MNRQLLLTSLAFVNAGFFVLIASFLPRASSFISTSALSAFFASRERWDIAVGATIGMLLLSTGFWFYLAARGKFD